MKSVTVPCFSDSSEKLLFRPQVPEILIFIWHFQWQIWNLPSEWRVSWRFEELSETWQINLALSLTSQSHTFMTFLMTKACLTGNYTYLKVSSPAAPGASSSGSWAHCWWRRARASCWHPQRSSSQSKESHKLSQSSKFIVFKHFQATSFFLRKSASDGTKWMPQKPAVDWLQMRRRP